MTHDELDLEVFQWLGEGLSPSPPAHLRLLGPGGDERGTRVLANLEVVATRLCDQPERWAALIRSRNWRPTLIGCSAVLLARDPRFLDDLLDRFRQRSWVSPQLAVALGLIHPNEAVPEFEALLRQAEAATSFMEVFSAYSALKILGRESALKFEASDLDRCSQVESSGRSRAAYAALVAVGTVHRHWGYWSSRNPR